MYKNDVKNIPASNKYLRKYELSSKSMIALRYSSRDCNIIVGIVTRIDEAKANGQRRGLTRRFLSLKAFKKYTAAKDPPATTKALVVRRARA